MHVPRQQTTLAAANSPTPGFALGIGAEPVGLVLDRDGASVWLLATGTNQVMHVQPDGAATLYQLRKSTLGLNLSQSSDGTVWAPEQYANAIVAISPDGSARECTLPRTNSGPTATAVASDGSVWVSEALGSAIAHLVNGRFVEYPIGVQGADLIAPEDGIWFSVNGAPILGHLTTSNEVQRIPIGGSGQTLGLLRTPDGATWVADFSGDRVVRVAGDGTVSALNTAAKAKPQSLALGPSNTIWLTESGIDHLAVVRGSAIQEVFHTGGWPDHLVITPDGWAWFTEYFEDRLGRLKLPG